MNGSPLRFVVGLGTVALLVVAFSGNYASAQVSGPVSHWPGDGDATNASDGNDGTLTEGATFATGKVGQAFSLDGIDDFVDVGNPANLHVSGGDFTVTAWVLFNALSHPPGNNVRGGPRGDMSIVDKMSASGANRDGWRLFKQNNNRFWFCFGLGTSNGCEPGVQSTVQSVTAATTGTWFHLAGVKSASEVALYIDGVK